MRQSRQVRQSRYSSTPALARGFFNRARGGCSLGSLPGHGSFRARSAGMRVVGGRFDVSDGVDAPTFSAISAVRVPGGDGLMGGPPPPGKGGA